MGIKRLLIELSIILFVTTSLVLALNYMNRNEINLSAFALETLLLSIAFIYLWSRFQEQLLLSLSRLISCLHNDIDPQNSGFQLKQLHGKLQNMSKVIREKAELEAMEQATKQVAHDIRGPLSCLRLLLADATHMQETDRLAINAVVQRITDIANTLPKKRKITNLFQDIKNDGKLTLLLPLIEELILEKQVALKDNKQISIIAKLNACHDAFILADPVEFRRVIANLLSNSLESFDDEAHQIELTVHCHGSDTVIEIRDDGCGIPNHITAKVFNYGFSYGKSTFETAGSGLGLYHAQQTILSVGGELTIDTKLGVGTTIYIRLPKADKPTWFIDNIVLADKLFITIVDDDPAIHQLWKRRFNAVHTCDIHVKHCQTLAEFTDYYQQHLVDNTSRKLYLIDYEFLTGTQTGLDCIESLNIATASILVTSHHERTDVQQRSLSMGVKILPKTLAANVPLQKTRLIECLSLKPKTIRLILSAQPESYQAHISSFHDEALLFSNSDSLLAWWQSHQDDHHRAILFVEHALPHDTMSAFDVINLFQATILSYLVVPTYKPSLEPSCHGLGIHMIEQKNLKAVLQYHTNCVSSVFEK